jgi:hypothetical protein
MKPHLVAARGKLRRWYVAEAGGVTAVMPWNRAGAFAPA